MEETRRGKGGREEPGEQDIWWTSGGQATEDLLRRTTSGRANDAQARVKCSRGVRKTRQNRQEPRNEERRENVRWEESLNVQNVRRERGESAGGAGQ